MKGWVSKRDAMGATHSLGYRTYLAGLGNTRLSCLIQWPPVRSGMVEVCLSTPLQGAKARLVVPIDSVNFDHEQLSHSWPLRAYPAFCVAWRAARRAGGSQHALRLMMDYLKAKKRTLA